VADEAAPPLANVIISDSIARGMALEPVNQHKVTSAMGQGHIRDGESNDLRLNAKMASGSDLHMGNHDKTSDALGSL
jgi:hypothetical protein